MEEVPVIVEEVPVFVEEVPILEEFLPVREAYFDPTPIGPIIGPRSLGIPLGR